jgi:energy-coupling factor transporter ATP-binding protein EcfA2
LVSQNSDTQSPTALLVEGLRFAYPPLSPDEPAPWVIDGIDLRIQQGEWLGVMGTSDVGKTTLCLLLAGLAPHLTRGTLEGRVVIAGRDTQEHWPPALADTVGLLFQEPEAQLFNPTVEAEIAWGLENLGLPVGEIRVRVSEILDLLGLDHARQRNPNGLSGGEKKRLALASVLALRPSVLILDEPMGGLDPAGRDEVLRALAKLRHEEQGQLVTIVMAESDPEAVAAFADRLIVLQQSPSLTEGAEGGQIALQGHPRTIFPQVDRLKALGVAIPQMTHIAVNLNQRLGTSFDFLTVREAQETLAVHLV